MPHKWMVALLALLMVLPLSAQTRESIEVRVLELEATVLDRSGRPVEGLTADDFEVRIGRQSVPITNFFAVRDGVVLADDAAARESTSPQTSIPTTLIIFVDELHLSPRTRKNAIDALQRYVGANVGQHTTATLIRYDKHFDVRVRPTERAGYIIGELEKMKNTPFAEGAAYERTRIIQLIDSILSPQNRGGIHPEAAGVDPHSLLYRVIDYAEHRASEVDRTLKALAEAIDLGRGLAGRKVLLYVSDGLPQQPAFEIFDYYATAYRTSSNLDFRVQYTGDPLSHAMRFDATDKFRNVIETAQRADVAIFTFDASGVRIADGMSADQIATRSRLNSVVMDSNVRGGLRYLAEETGGLYIGNDNNADRAMARISEQFSTYYSIGVKPRKGDIRIAVRNRPELRVVTAKRQPPRTRDDEFEQSLRTRLYTRAVDNPLRVRLEVGRPSRVESQCVVQVRVALPQPQLAPELTPQLAELRMVMLNEQNDETPLRNIAIPFAEGKAAHLMVLKIRPQKHVLSVSVANPLSGEASYLQGEIDGTQCH